MILTDIEAERRLRFQDDDALHTAGPLFEALVLENLRHRNTKRKRCQRQIMPV